jgi:hypothetical protein
MLKDKTELGLVWQRPSNYTLVVCTNVDAYKPKHKEAYVQLYISKGSGN